MHGSWPAVAVPLIALLSGCSPAPVKTASGGPPPAPVKVAQAASGTLPVEVRAIGNVEAYSTISVKSQITGTLMSANFREGEPVKKGQLLFEIDPRPYQQAIQQTQANIARDAAMLKQAEANLERDIAQEKFYRDQARRYESLAKQGVFSKMQSDQAISDADAHSASVGADRAAIESALQAIAADQSQLDNAKLQLTYCSIYSPVDGRSGNISVKVGNLVKATDVELVTLMQIQPVYVTFTVPEKQLPAIQARMRAGKLTVRAIRQGDPTNFDEGVLTFVNNAVDQATGTIKLKATFTNGAARLWPGQFVDVVLTLSQKPSAITIPYKAVQVGQSGNYVFVVRADQTVEMRPVVTGATVGNVIEIERGVKAGESVVIDGHIRLAAGSRVKVQS